MKYILVSLVFILAGCVSVPPISGSVEETRTIYCDEPIKFTQDCSDIVGPKREISIAGVKSKVASNAEGTIIFTIWPNPVSDKAKDFYLLNSPNNSKSTNQSAMSIKKLFNDNEIAIIELRYIEMMHNIMGYIFYLDKDGYSVLKQYTVED